MSINQSIHQSIKYITHNVPNSSEELGLKIKAHLDQFMINVMSRVKDHVIGSLKSYGK